MPPTHSTNDPFIDLTDGTPVRSLRPPRRRGFAADLALGSYLFAQEDMAYAGTGEPDRQGWRPHRFVAVDGRGVDIGLPPGTKMYVPPPDPAGGRVIDRSAVLGRTPPMSMTAALASRELGRVHRLWRAYGRPPRATD